MTPADVVAALAIPPAAVVNQRVTKKLLIDNGAPTAADKRRITDGVNEVRWVAALKPSTIGIAAYSDATREYLEIAVITARLNTDAKTARIAELIHRAIPYPVLLIATQPDCTTLSAGHKRWSIAESDRVVLDGEVICVDVADDADSPLVVAFGEVLPIASRPHSTLLALYQRWIDAIGALQAAARTGKFIMMDSAADAERRRVALVACATLEANINATRAAATKATQMARRVELNLELQRLQGDLDAALANI